jgi:hypothetical protein
MINQEQFMAASVKLNLALEIFKILAAHNGSGVANKEGFLICLETVEKAFERVYVTEK